MFKQEKGITLVALVLVIVVLLIISGVSISVVVQNSDLPVGSKNTNTSVSNSKTNTSFEDAKDKVKLIFELCEANYQIDLAKGDATDRSQVFTAETILGMLQEYNIKGNTLNSLGQINVTEGVTIKYNQDFTFIVRVSTGGMVTVIKK